MFLFLGLSSVSAQNSGSFINTEDGEPRFFQRLAWSGGEYALRYEVVIESGAGGTYRPYRREFTTELYINISLQPGSYRFRVTPYDILNRPGAASEWKYIEVLPALSPELFSVLPEYMTGGGGEPLGFLLYLTGANLDRKAEIFVRSAQGTLIAAETLDLSDSNGDTIIAYVESDLLIPGEYGIIVRNPGGLEAGMGGVSLLLPEPETIEIADKSEPEIEISTDEEELADTSEPETELFPLKPVMFGAGFALIPSFPVYGDYVKGGIAVYGLIARVNLLFFIPIGVYIGPELSVMALLTNYPDENGEYFTNTFDPGNIQDRFTLMVGANLLIRKWFPDRRAALSFRAGADYFKIFSDEIDQVNIRMDISFLWRFTNYIMIEGGLDYSHLLLGDSGGFFRPWLGIGFQF
jgi:hypothetical protein